MIDSAVEASRVLLLARSQVGIAKYGVTLADSPCDLRVMLQHGLEEALDLANYLQAAIMKLDNDPADD